MRTATASPTTRTATSIRIGGATIVIGGIDTGVPNAAFPTGCTAHDLISKLAAASTNHGSFVSAVAHLTNQWVADHTYTGREKGAIQSAAARSK